MPGPMMYRDDSFQRALWRLLPPALACRSVPTRRRFGGLPCVGHGLSTPGMGVILPGTSHATLSRLPQMLLTTIICYPRSRALDKAQAKTIHGRNEILPSAIRVLSTTPESLLRDNVDKQPCDERHKPASSPSGQPGTVPKRR